MIAKFHCCYSQSLLEKHQKRLVTAVVLCMFIVIITTVSWGMPVILARLPPASAAETILLPFGSKEGMYIRAALRGRSPTCRYCNTF
jgi:hypothetical protein